MWLKMGVLGFGMGCDLFLFSRAVGIPSGKRACLHGLYDRIDDYGYGCYEGASGVKLSDWVRMSNLPECFKVSEHKV